LAQFSVQEAIPFRESASALLGGGKPLSKPLSSAVARNDISHFARRINFPAKSTIFNASEPCVTLYPLKQSDDESERKNDMPSAVKVTPRQHDP
jgi:hypothetical protein